MSKLNEAEVRERAGAFREKYPDHYKPMDTLGYVADANGIIRDLLTLLDEKDKVIGQVPWDKIKTLPDEWCEKCLYYLLRFNRKNGIECDDADEPDHPYSLDDDHFEAIADLIRWAQGAARNEKGDTDGIS